MKDEDLKADIIRQANNILKYTTEQYITLNDRLHELEVKVRFIENSVRYKKWWRSK